MTDVKVSWEDYSSLYFGCSTKDYAVISENIVDESRWENQYEIICQERNEPKRFFRVDASRGKTECQDHSGLEEEEKKDFVELPELKKVQKLVEVWRLHNEFKNIPGK